MKFTKRKTEIWNYPILSEHHDKIMDVKEYVSKFETLPIVQFRCIYIFLFARVFAIFVLIVKNRQDPKKSKVYLNVF